MSSEHQILVRGEAERQAPADLAGLSVLVQADHAEQHTAFERASGMAAAVDTVLDAHTGALSPRQSAVVVVQPTARWVDGEEQRTGWRAARSSRVEVTDLGHLTPLLAELVAAGAIVHGPWWQLRPGHPVLAEARTAAATDARARAESYATGLGVQVGRVEWVSEPGLRVGAGFPSVGVVAGAASKWAAGMAQEGAGMEIAPAELTIGATVEVAFAIER